MGNKITFQKGAPNLFIHILMLCDKNISHNCDKVSSIGILSIKFTPIINVVLTIQQSPNGPYSEFVDYFNLLVGFISSNTTFEITGNL